MSKLYDIIIGAADSSAVINNAIKEKNRGIVITQFNVDTLGKVTDIKIVEGLRNDIDNEVLRIINLLDIGWTSVTQMGKKIDVLMTLPV